MTADDDATEAERSYMGRWLLPLEAARRHARLRQAIHAAGFIDAAQLAESLGLPLAVIESDLRLFEMQAQAEQLDDEFLRVMQKRQG
jgi:hypothetical protein